MRGDREFVNQFFELQHRVDTMQEKAPLTEKESSRKPGAARLPQPTKP